ncbi:MAG: hypothetical protein EOP24_32090 [Hyphomicrobiales bacterium]|nr:MAG: hypothetical protein EOP24_32090 [Hyphomicrobiales bacterium]
MTILPIVLFDDIEMWAASRIRELLATRTEDYAENVYVGRSTPSPRRERMVTIRRDGGGRFNRVLERPRLGVNVWAGTVQEANDLARLVASLLAAAPDGDPVTSVTITSGPYSIEDDSKQERRYFTAELTARGRDDA